METHETSDAQVRINRFLADAGVCSRRDADEVISAGRVTVNGETVKDSFVRINVEKDAVKVSGKRIFPQRLVYILMNKPEGVISTVEDPEKRTTVVDLLKGVKYRVYPVGRLDFNTSGALMLTNDGDLAQKLMHPRYGFSKTYHATVKGVPTPTAIQRLAAGVRIPAWSGRYEKTLPAKARLVRKVGKNAVVELVLREGRQHQVKKMCAAIGHPVDRLVRIKFGFLTSAGLLAGRWRYLSDAEVGRIRQFRPEKSSSLSRPVRKTSGRPVGRTKKHTRSKR
ncbi:rRNA pseudouridine synthase [bacterium]|nr:rRNA pseudouridine synthase [bacterium]